jgi:hypothetical protein
MIEVDKSEAEMAWLVYDLQLEKQQKRYKLERFRTVYTQFETALEKITRTEAGDIRHFMGHLQEKLDAKLENGHSPDAPTLADVFDSEGI